MGRELKRVPMNFKWEVNKLWCGYINPHKVHKCQSCDGSGNSEDYERLSSEWYGHYTESYASNPFRAGWRYNTSAWQHNITEQDIKALLKGGRLMDFTRVPITDEQKEIVKKKMANGGNSWLPFDNGYVPTPKEVNDWNLQGMGHDSTNAWICIKARLKREKKSHKCQSCKGSGENWQSPITKKLYKNWKSYDPPKGEGFQLWTTTSEGAPMTPVFESLELLCEYCERENISVFGSSTATKERWMQMLSDDFVTHQEGNVIFI